MEPPRAAAVAYVTSNAGKYAEAEAALGVLGGRLGVERVGLELVEPQGTPQEVAVAKAADAVKQLRAGAGPPLARFDYVLVEDVSFGLRCLNGFPGVYVKPMLEAIGPEGLWGLAERYPDRGADVACTLGVVPVAPLLARAEGEPPVAPSVRLFVGTLSGTVVPPRGEGGHGGRSWSVCFVPDGYEHTFGEIPLYEQARMSHRHAALAKFVEACCR